MARTKLEVDRPALERAIKKADEEGGKNISDLCQKATALYNAGSIPRKITPAVVRLRLEEWGLEIKTKKGRNCEPKVISPRRDSDSSPAKIRRTPKVDTPAGPCPVKLKGVDRESVENWAREVMLLDGERYSEKAVVYFVRQFYDYGSSDWKNVVDILIEVFCGVPNTDDCG